MVSAVVLAYNRSNEVLITIQKLKEFKKTFPYDLEIIVIDNASTDQTSALVQKTHSDIILITKTENNGIAGWNEGFKVAKNKYFLVLDDDSHIHSGLTEAIDYMEQNENVGILALNIKDSLLRDYDIPPEIAWKDKQEIEGFIGCGAIIRKEVYQKIGGYAEWVYVYTHEFDYGLRCLQAGYIIRFFEKAVVSHRTSSVNRTNKRMRLYGARNEMAIVYKFFPKNRWKYILRVFLNNMKSIKKEGFYGGYVVLLGAIAFLKMRKKLGYTPVSEEVQSFYSNRFISTKPVFDKLKKTLFFNLHKLLYTSISK